MYSLFRLSNVYEIIQFRKKIHYHVNTLNYRFNIRIMQLISILNHTRVFLANVYVCRSCVYVCVCVCVCVCVYVCVYIYIYI